MTKKIEIIGAYGPVDTPCRHWWGERHKWSPWNPTSSRRHEGEVMRACTNCEWVEIGEPPAVYEANLAAIRARLESGESLTDIVNNRD